MKEKIMNYLNKSKTYWKERTKLQKGIYIGSVIGILALVVIISLLATKTNFTPLYNDLSMQEANQIKTELDAQGIPYEIEDGGTTINVPEEKKDSLLIELAGQGIPNSGNIDYSFFSENTSWGVTDNEFNMLKLDAMQTELANLIKGIDGIKDAQVMINIPEEPVFVSEQAESASASIVLHTDPGYKFQGNQINALYTLVSKAVPNLPADNIAIMNQYFEYFDKDELMNSPGQNNDYTYQQTVKKDIERDLQKRVQQMLGTIVGQENVIVSVTTDIDFTQENRVEEIVEPVDEQNMEGVPISVEKIQESYTGRPDEVGGVAGTGDEDIAGYQGTDESENGDYELVKETINSEYNRIKKEIVESPYKIRDLGMQVAVNNVKNKNDNEIEYLTQQDQEIVEQGMMSILNSIVTTTVDKSYEEELEESLDQNSISVTFQEFADRSPQVDVKPTKIPVWAYIVGGILVVLLIVLFILLIRRRNVVEEESEIIEEETPFITEQKVDPIKVDQDSEQMMQEKQLEKMAKDKPDEFAKLLRSWIGDE